MVTQSHGNGLLFGHVTVHAIAVGFGAAVEGSYCPMFHLVHLGYKIPHKWPFVNGFFDFFLWLTWLEGRLPIPLTIARTNCALDF